MCSTDSTICSECEHKWPNYCPIQGQYHCLQCGNTWDDETHYDIIRSISNEGWDFNYQFIRAIIHPKNEYKDKHPLAYAFGTEVEETGKHFCPYCDEYLTDEACDGFEDNLKVVLRREVIEPYMEKHCPRCEEPLEDTKLAHEISFSRDAVSETVLSSDEITKPETVEKTKYEPCGCLHERGEEEILWDIDKEKVEREVSFYGYDGKIFNESRPQNDFWDTDYK